MNARQLRTRNRIFTVVVAAACLLIVYFYVREAKAAESHQVLANMIMVDAGVCGMNANGTVAPSPEKAAYARQCDIGINPMEPSNLYFFILGYDGEVESITKGNIATGAQIIIWHKDQKRI